MHDLQVKGTVDDLIDALRSLPAEVRARRVMVFDGGSVTSRISIEFWPSTAENDRPAVILDCC